MGNDEAENMGGKKKAKKTTGIKKQCIIPQLLHPNIQNSASIADDMEFQPFLLGNGKGLSEPIFKDGDCNGIALREGFGNRLVLCHIAMRQCWIDNLLEFNDLDKAKMFVFAGCNGHFKLFMNLLDQVSQILSDPDAHDSGGKRYQSLSTLVNYILPSASLIGSFDMVKFILEVLKLLLGCKKYAIAESVQDVNDAFQQACAGGDHADVAKLLLDIHGVDLTANNNQAFRLATKRGHTNVVRLLSTVDGVDGGANNNEESKTRLEILLQMSSVNPAVNSNEVLLSAVKRRHTGVVTAFLSCDRLDASENDNAALMMAVDSGCRIRSDRYLELLQAIVDPKGVDPRAQNCKAIKTVACNGWVDGLKVLLRSEALHDMSDEEKGRYLLEGEEILESSRENGSEDESEMDFEMDHDNFYDIDDGDEMWNDSFDNMGEDDFENDSIDGGVEDFDEDF
ncbi:hypothetical protein HDU76_009409 [Blyttiomyces sp. JEL0837]|nr:hypothetical protein HDU76_009409 [Blyttiomyces sp. JEL0837]